MLFLRPTEPCGGISRDEIESPGHGLRDPARIRKSGTGEHSRIRYTTAGRWGTTRHGDVCALRFFRPPASQCDRRRGVPHNGFCGMGILPRPRALIGGTMGAMLITATRCRNISPDQLAETRLHDLEDYSDRRQWEQAAVAAMYSVVRKRMCHLFFAVAVIV